VTTFRVAAAALPIERHARLGDYLSKLDAWVDRAVSNGAKLLVFPEYGAVEATSIFGDDASDLQLSTRRLQAILPDIDNRLTALARAHALHILGPSAPRFDLRDPTGGFRNTALFFGPSGRCLVQQKLIPTPWDRDPWKLSAGAGQTVFDTALGKIGVAICYDVEFPQLVRNLCAAGAEMILAPSCTDAVSGYWRVRTGAQARALENQCIVVQSPTVGNAPWSPALDVNVGAAGVFGPPDLGFPETGVIALGEMNAPGWIYADIDLSLVRKVRASGATRNHFHWGEQPTRAVETVELV